MISRSAMATRSPSIWSVGPACVAPVVSGAAAVATMQQGSFLPGTGQGRAISSINYTRHHKKPVACGDEDCETLHYHYSSGLRCVGLVVEQLAEVERVQVVGDTDRAGIEPAGLFQH